MKLKGSKLDGLAKAPSDVFNGKKKKKEKGQWDRIFQGPLLIHCFKGYTFKLILTSKSSHQESPMTLMEELYKQLSYPNNLW